MTIEERFTVDDRPELDVRVQSGRIEIVRGEPGQIRVTVDTSDSDFTVEQRGNLIVVSSDKSTSWLSRDSAYAVIEAPEHSDATMATASARVECQIPLSHVEVKSASGEVDLSAAQTADLRTASGDARIGRTEKALRFKSASGDLFVTDRCEGTVALASASGDIHLAEVHASLDVNTVSGDVYIPRFFGQKAVLKSMSGDIRVGVPAGTNVDLDASLLSGALHLPDKPEVKTDTQRHMTIRAKLVSGDLRIDRI